MHVPVHSDDMIWNLKFVFMKFNPQLRNVRCEIRDVSLVRPTASGWSSISIGLLPKSEALRDGRKEIERRFCIKDCASR
jgi:hypothetical protein